MCEMTMAQLLGAGMLLMVAGLLAIWGYFLTDQVLILRDKSKKPKVEVVPQPPPGKSVFRRLDDRDYWESVFHRLDDRVVDDRVVVTPKVWWRHETATSNVRKLRMVLRPTTVRDGIACLNWECVAGTGRTADGRVIFPGTIWSIPRDTWQLFRLGPAMQERNE